MAARPQFEVIEEADPVEPKPPLGEWIGISALALGLATLSKRAIAAIGDLFFLVSVASAWYLWFLTPDPSSFQIVSLTIYALFVLAANWLVRR